ncbi:hypothetical protein H6F67_10135 [Microcoleus sp. FACHB-1515]|uniref:hypothetical protein n=1 Tax=Cyanophyceae TaxID=3028117 RepID=UPI00168990FA|nr:hypothetical protein [Microcoleus sp. FACHB-1515]MBD2090210.1 hypothetical protein [Microcoleus sp. FACHB-1515]
MNGIEIQLSIDNLIEIPLTLEISSDRPASKDLIDLDQIPDLPASKITSGVMEAERLPALDEEDIPPLGKRVVLEVEAVGQDFFDLEEMPIAPHLSELFVGGIKATYGSEYVIDGFRLQWRSPLLLEPGEEIELVYQS